ncbi:MAG TPA: alpha/beta hydrolase [Bryobacteraceae bacterium]|nr:alpha/beta hydrolase [Bryobacteraceae bacterium]
MRAAFFLCCLPLVAQPYPPPGALVDLGTYRVHLYCTGAGSPAVIVTGAGYSFDWALVQPEVAKFTRICTYDPAGFAWSDAGPGPECGNRVADLHLLLAKAGIGGPYILAGLSYGALVAREYAAHYATEVAGVVLIDHAFLDPVDLNKPETPRRPNSPPVLISQTPIVLTMEDISNFGNLPQRSRELHRWADSLHPVMPSVENARECATQLDGKTLGDKPLVVVSTLNDAPNYAPLQTSLLALSKNHRQLISTKSFHAIQIDEPEVIIRAIRLVFETAR